MISKGDCFRWAAKYISAHPSSMLVHALIKMPGKTDKRIAHAWVEDANFIYDWQNMHHISNGPILKKTYYSIVKPKNIKRYTREQVLINMLTSQHYGPWDVC